MQSVIYNVFFLIVQAVGFVWGYVCQQFSQTVYILLAGFALACLVRNTILNNHASKAGIMAEASYAVCTQNLIFALPHAVINATVVC